MDYGSRKKCKGNYKSIEPALKILDFERFKVEKGLTK